MAGGAVPVAADPRPMAKVVRHGKAGLAVPREDASTLAAAVRRLILDQTEMVRVSEAARDRLAQDLKQLPVAARIAETLRGTVHDRRREQ